MNLIGQHSLAISNAKHLFGNFNAHLRETVFLFADEAFYAGDKAHTGALKSLITESTLAIEAKYANVTLVKNHSHRMMASAEAWVIPASLDAGASSCCSSPRPAKATSYGHLLLGNVFQITL